MSSQSPPYSSTTASQQQSQHQKTILITGANQGIGYETARLLALSSTPSSPHQYHILIGTRSLPRGETAIAALRTACPTTTATFSPLQLDVNSDTSIAAAVQRVGEEYGSVDVLVNNAGVSVEGKAESEGLSVREVWRRTFETNVFGQVGVTEGFMELLLRSSPAKGGPRVLFLTSGLGSLRMACDPEDRYYGLSAVAYRSSKAALNMVMVDCSKKLAGRGGLVWGVCPGHRATMLGGSREVARSMGATDPEDGARVVVDTVEGKRDRDKGKVVCEEGLRPW